MTVERIGRLWPRPVDTSGAPAHYIEILRNRLLPFDMEDPFVFHVLSTVGQHGGGEQELLQIMRDGGALLPRSWAEERWGDKKSMIFARDAVAGDDDWLFTTPCNVFAVHHERALFNPAVAYRLSTVAEHKIAFRVHDLEPQYRQAEQLASDPHSEWFDEEDDPSEYESPDWYEEEKAESVREQLETVAEIGTQHEAEAARGLVLLYAEMLGSFRQKDSPLSIVSREDPQALYLMESAWPLFPEVVQLVLDSDEETMAWLDGIFVADIADSLAIDWRDLFRAGAGPVFPWRLMDAPSIKRPELLVQGTLPLCDAAYYRDGQGQWLPVPDDVCAAGQKVVASNPSMYDRR
jgi:hypothetical protein